MSRVCIFLNSPYLGGAERSMIIQASMMPSRCHFIIPRLLSDSGDEILSFIRSSLEDNYTFEYIDYPPSLYEVSRSGVMTKYLSILYSFLLIYLEFRRVKLSNDDIVWINGNKIGLPVILYLIISGFSHKLIWHFRDYPFNQGVFKAVWKILRGDFRFKKILVSNSDSVTEAVKKVCHSQNNEFITLYNPVGDLNISKDDKKTVTKIGIVSMFAPWKGLHTIIDFEKLYRTELLSLGIEEILIFGADIYKTSGAHDSYASQLKKTYEQRSLIKFMGKREVKDIFQNIDLLIHCSIDKEPFGRVIVEGFASDTPVISTGLGGSGELVIHQKTGARYFPYDYAGLFKEIEKFSLDLTYRKKVLNEARMHLEKIENNQKEILRSLCLES